MKVWLASIFFLATFLSSACCCDLAAWVSTSEQTASCCGEPVSESGPGEPVSCPGGGACGHFVCGERLADPIMVETPSTCLPSAPPLAGTMVAVEQPTTALNAGRPPEPARFPGGVSFRVLYCVHLL